MTRTIPKNGFCTRPPTNKVSRCSSTGGTRLRNKYICKTILDIAKVKESATFLVSKDPVKTELGSFYRIILSCPILPKNKPKL